MTMNGPPRKPWFRPKRIGYGWSPNSWQGWLLTFLPGIIILAAGIVVALVFTLRA